MFFFFIQDAESLPADQDLLLPLEGPERLLSRCEEARPDCDGWSWRRCGQDRRPERRSLEPQWAARLHSACGPCQLQGAEMDSFWDNELWCKVFLKLRPWSGHKPPVCMFNNLHICNICLIALLSQILSHNLLVVMATMFPNDFTPEVHVSMDKFLAAVALALSEKYR